MGYPTKLTPEAYAAIPMMVAEGKRPEEIAAVYGCSPGTLKVQCSKKGISLRRGVKPNPKPLEVASPKRPEKLKLSPSASFILHLAAEKRASDVNSLARDLLETIAKDNLFAAVLDTENA
jgi:hypothetical protein